MRGPNHNIVSKVTPNSLVFFSSFISFRFMFIFGYSLASADAGVNQVIVDFSRLLMISLSSRKVAINLLIFVDGVFTFDPCIDGYVICVL